MGITYSTLSFELFGTSNKDQPAILSSYWLFNAELPGGSVAAIGMQLRSVGQSHQIPAQTN